jgi:aryl-alcohol dehydrogenase-like predicted oxidoreductase
MQYGKLPGIDKPISRLVQGTIPIGSDHLDASFKLLDDIYALGCTTFDTAHVYGNGDIERTFGRWMNDRGLRDKLVILGKGAHHSQDRQRVTPHDITSDIFDSLARMKTDYIDLYLLHRDNPAVPVGPIVEVLNEHLKAGRIHAFGGSNWTHARVQEANTYAAEHGLQGFSASSPNFSLAEQVKEPWPNCVTISGPKNVDARDYYTRHHTPLFTWSSLAGGFFSGRFTRDNLSTFDGYFDKLCVDCYCVEANFQRLDRVKQLGQEIGLSIPQVAMAYVMSQPMDIFALVGCQNGEEFAANIAATEHHLSPETLAWLDLRSDTR